MRLFVFGAGYIGLAFARHLAADGWAISTTARTAADRAALTAQGYEAVDPADPAALQTSLAQADAVLVTAPPSERGCPAFEPVRAAMAAGARPAWTGYLSSTGVYGDRGGRWVFEDSTLFAQSVAGGRRVAAEHDWLDLGAKAGAAVCIFRLPGIYGPGRSAFDRLRAGDARRIVRPSQVFSRIHRDDLTAALGASLARPRAGGVYNICDDEPCPPQDLIAEAARQLGVEPPPEIPFDATEISAASARFFAESKRVSNARAKAELGWRPAYPTYREGLRAILAEGG